MYPAVPYEYVKDHFGCLTDVTFANVVVSNPSPGN